MSDTLPPDLGDMLMQDPPDYRVSYSPRNLWDRLATEGRHDLITTLRHVELNTPGYGTIIVPPEGYSQDDTTHNMVLDYLNHHHINILNVQLTIEKLTRALRIS